MAWWVGGGTDEVVKYLKGSNKATWRSCTAHLRCSNASTISLTSVLDGRKKQGLYWQEQEEQGVSFLLSTAVLGKGL